jgi:NAD(P)H-nitrite reductase large subunit
MKENYTICNCKKVTYFDIADALHDMENFDDVLKAFEDVQKVTHCSTGCGGCHQKVLDVISEILMGHEKV